MANTSSFNLTVNGKVVVVSVASIDIIESDVPTLPPAVVELAELPRAPAAEARESEAESSRIVSTALTVGGGVAVVVALGAGGYLALNGGAAGAAGAGANSLPTAKTEGNMDLSQEQQAQQEDVHNLVDDIFEQVDVSNVDFNEHMDSLMSDSAVSVSQLFDRFRQHGMNTRDVGDLVGHYGP